MNTPLAHRIIPIIGAIIAGIAALALGWHVSAYLF